MCRRRLILRPLPTSGTARLLCSVRHDTVPPLVTFVSWLASFIRCRIIVREKTEHRAVRNLLWRLSLCLNGNQKRSRSHRNSYRVERTMLRARPVNPRQRARRTHEIKNDEIKNDEIKNDEIKNDEIKNDEIKNEIKLKILG
jgi:hypothetical protein